MFALPEPFSLHGEHIAIELPGASALFTTRRGGVSEGPYASLNLGHKTDDRPQNVAVNRRTLAQDLGVELSFMRQVHGNQVVAVGSPGRELPQADGQVTATRGVGLAALVADCLPIALVGGDAVAIVHAGWRGLAGGVIEAAVGALRGTLHAAIGPGAGPCCYQVGEEVLSRFGSAGSTLDLKAIARSQLQRAGAHEVHDVGLCTMCAPELFFSHRRDGGVTGRQAGIAWLN
jgi:YfiH family protein